MQRGDQWAQTAPRENYRTGTSTGAARTGPGGDRTTVGRTGSGDIYAGRDGNVYRRNEGGGWEQHDGSGGWNQVPTPSREQARDRAATAGGRQVGQLEGDRRARVQGSQRAVNRGSWQAGGGSRAGAGSFGGGRARTGGGRRR